MNNNFDKKPGSLEEAISGVLKDDSNKYQQLFKKELEKVGKGIGAMTPQEKKDFFNNLDKKYSAKSENAPSAADLERLKKMGMKKEEKKEVEELTAAQKKLPPALQKAIKKKEGDMKEGTMIGGLMKYAGQPSSEYMKAKQAYKTFMSKPQPVKGAADKVMAFVFDDDLLDDLYDAEKKGVKDVRNMVAKRLAKLGVREDVDLEEGHIKSMDQNAKQIEKTKEGEPMKRIEETIRDMWSEAATKEDEKQSEKVLKAQKNAATGSKASEIDKDPEIKYEK